MAELIYTTIASRSTHGPLVRDVSFTEALQLLKERLTNYQAFLDHLRTIVNSSVIEVEESQPEGQRLELTIRGLTIPLLGSRASYLAGKIQELWLSGQIRDPEGKNVAPWPEYPNQIAWGDDQTDTLTLRWQKWFTWGWVIAGFLLGLAVGIGAYNLFRKSDYTMQSATPKQQQQQEKQPGQPTNIIGWLLQNWQLVLLGLGALAIAPFAVRQVAALRRARTELEEAEAEAEAAALDTG